MNGRVSGALGVCPGLAVSLSCQRVCNRHLGDGSCSVPQQVVIPCVWLCPSSAVPPLSPTCHLINHAATAAHIRRNSRQFP